MGALPAEIKLGVETSPQTRISDTDYNLPLE